MQLVSESRDHTELQGRQGNSPGNPLTVRNGPVSSLVPRALEQWSLKRNVCLQGAR